MNRARDEHDAFPAALPHYAGGLDRIFVRVPARALEQNLVTANAPRLQDRCDGARLAGIAHARVQQQTGTPPAEEIDRGTQTFFRVTAEHDRDVVLDFRVRRIAYGALHTSFETI